MFQRLLQMLLMLCNKIVRENSCKLRWSFLKCGGVSKLNKQKV